MITFKDRIVIPASIEDAFDLSLDIDVHKEAFSHSNERAVSGVTTGTIGLNETVTWKARHFMIPWTMTSRITAFERPTMFVDEQLKGPFKSFRHEHRFTADGDNTILEDQVAFEAPFGLLGTAVERAILGKYMRKLIHIRNEFLVEKAHVQRFGHTDADPTIAGVSGAYQHRQGKFVALARSVPKWLTRNHQTVAVTKLDVDQIVVPHDSKAPVEDGQGVQDGSGAVFHRTFRTVVDNATISAAEAMAKVQANPNLIAPTDLAPFVKDVGASDSLAVGDRFTVRIAGPWNGPVEVTHVDELSFRMTTLDGHLEAGAIELRVEAGEGSSLSFTIQTWARSADRLLDVLYDKVGVAKAVQSEMWVETGEGFVELVGGVQVGPVQLTEERSPNS